METMDQITLKRTKTIERVALSSPFECYKVSKMLLGDDIDLFENFLILLLNQAGDSIGWAKISQGAVTHTVVDVRLIAKYAIETLATGVILVHNHPSGSLRPSKQDDKLTQDVTAALQLFGITTLDHLIITATDYYSYSENGRIKQ